MTPERLQEIEASIGRIECPECGGSGVYLDVPTGNEACDECDGSGMVSQFPPADELIAAVRTLQADLAQARAEAEEAQAQLTAEIAENLSLRSQLSAANTACADAQRLAGFKKGRVVMESQPEIVEDIDWVRQTRDEWIAKHTACVDELQNAEATIATLREQLTSTQQILRDAYAEAAAAGTWVEADLPTMVRSLVQQVTTLREQLQAAQAPCMCCREVTQPCQHGCRCAHPTPAQEGE